MKLDPADVALCIHDSTDALPPGGAPTSVPIVMTSLFSFPTLEALQEGLSAEHRTHVYTRGQNPTVEALERKLATLERGEACKCFGSGMAAISAVLSGVLEAGDHVLFVNHTYGPTLQLAERLRAFGVAHDVVLDTSVEAVEAAIRPNTKLMWLESPGTMMMRLLDLPAIAALAHRRNVLTCIDNSWATPLLQKPIPLGVDIVVHTLSKYINGHSDLMAGAIITNATLLEQIFYRTYLLQGGILTPHDAWLILRGMKTLPTRMRQHEADALQVARALADHAGVRAVFHPALLGDDALAEKQFAGWSGVFSFELTKDDLTSVRTVVNGLRLFRIGVSWGGAESLVIAPANGKNAQRLADQHLPQGLVRVSIGLEGADALVEDLTQALALVS